MSSCILTRINKTNLENVYIYGQFGGLQVGSGNAWASLISDNNSDSPSISTFSNNYNHSGNVFTRNKIDVTKFKKLTVCGRVDGNGTLNAGLTTSGNTETFVANVSINTSTYTEKVLDISNLTGEYYFTYTCYRGDYKPTYYLRYAYFSY